ncbi:MAG: Mu-like prophage major head subunit gpT family protein [Bacillota bacterium]|nr:Mu-like prophage major head subunit gpT family protein [Bacillota bacterium]
MIFSKAAGVANSIYGKSQEPIKMMLEQQEEAFQKMSIIDKVFFKDETKDFANKYTIETSLGNFVPVGENGKYPESNFQEGYSKVIEPETWKLQFSVTQEMVEDAKIGKIKSRASAFMLSFNRTKELFAAGLINNGNSSTMLFGNKSFDITGADKVALFSTSHPSITGGTGVQSNLYNGAFSYDNLSAAEEKMHYFKDDDGNILTVSPDTIVIPDKAAIKKLVFEAIGAEGIPGTANNSYSYQFGRWNVVISPYLTDYAGTTSGLNTWYLLDSSFNDAYQALVWLDRIPLTTKSYIDENTDANIFAGRARYAAAPNNWRTMLCSAPGLAGASSF